MKNILTERIKMIKKYIRYNQKKTELDFYPDRLYLELTNNCNFQCIMCPNGRGLMQREKGFMDYELAKNIIDEMGPHINTVVLHIWGESLLHPRIFDIIRYCQKYNVRTELSTNTSLLNEENIPKIIDSGLSTIYLCMDGVTKETYEYVRKNGDYDKAIKNIGDFIKVKKEKNSVIFVNLQIIIMKETLGEIEKFQKRWSIDGINKINVKPLDTWGGQVSEINSLKVATPLFKPRVNKENNRYHCPNLWYHVHIYHNGDIVCCDRDFDAKNALGNVKGGVIKAWNGTKMQQLRQKHINNDLNDVVSCGNCNEWCWWKPTVFSSWGNIPKK